MRTRNYLGECGSSSVGVQLNQQVSSSTSIQFSQFPMHTNATISAEAARIPWVSQLDYFSIRGTIWFD